MTSNHATTPALPNAQLAAAFDIFKDGVPSLMLTAYAVVKRTFQEKVTYRTQMILGVMTGLVSLVQFAILGYYISLGGMPPGLDQYGGSIIAFMIVGSLFSALSLMMMNTVKVQIQTEQRRGTLEMIALSRGGLLQFVISGSIFGLASTLVFSVLIFAIFGIFFNFTTNINPLGLILTIALTIACMWLVGLCAGSYILVSKQGEPITWTITTLLTLFSGVMYPTTIFPDFIEQSVKLLPMTGMLHALRISLFSGASTMEILTTLLPTLLITVILLPVGPFAWSKSINMVRQQGTLGSY